MASNVCLPYPTLACDINKPGKAWESGLSAFIKITSTRIQWFWYMY